MKESPPLWHNSGADAIEELNRLSRFERDQTQKADAGKTDPVLFERDLVNAVNAINRVLDYGAAKYEPGGWQTVDPARYDSAARRHRRDRDKGELRDVESGMVHLAHEACNLLFQLELFIRQNPDMDFHSFKTPPTHHKEKKDAGHHERPIRIDGQPSVDVGDQGSRGPFNSYPSKGVRNRLHAQPRSTEHGKGTTSSWVRGV